MSKLQMETSRRISIPDEISMEIIARLPLRSIARFKSVCKQWRSLIESSYFRTLFVFLHKNSYSSWSLMFPIKLSRSITEAIGFYGCERWALTKSPASYFTPYPNGDHFFYVDSSHGLVWMEVFLCSDHNNIETKSFVGNPVSQEWVEIPPLPDHVNMPSGLVTRAVNGVVSSFKVVRTSTRIIEPRERAYVWRVYVYSSETGVWTFRTLSFSSPLQRPGLNTPLNLNGMLYVWEKRLDDDDTSPGVIVSYDFYAQDEDNDQCQVIPLPVPDSTFARRCLTTSCGGVIYVEVLDGRLKVWKLKNSNNSDGEWWQLKREEISMAYVDCFPLGMNPLDTDLVYLWSSQHRCVVSGNLKTQKFTLHKESETWSDSEGCWRVNSSDSKECMNALHDPPSVITLSQFVLPQWMDPVPRQPN